MQSVYPERFEREMGCTEADWLRWLPAAVGPWPLQLRSGAANVSIERGTLLLRWQVASPRVIAQVRLPRLQVRFRFEGLGSDQRFVFMKRFDLYMQRGGG